MLSPNLGILIFARYDSNRLPGKALRSIGGIPLLERVIRRAQLTEWPVYLATTEKPSDDALVDLAKSLGVPTFRGSENRVLERAVTAAETFGLDAFARLCGDRPLFPIAMMNRALMAMRDRFESAIGPDLVSDYVAGQSIRGLTTEVVRTVTLRRILDEGVSADQQEHVTLYFYDHPEDFHIVTLSSPPARFACPGFALDTEEDLVNLRRIFGMDPSVDLDVAEADRIFLS